MKNSKTIRLTISKTAFEKKCGRKSLNELLNEVEAILNPDGPDRNWIVRNSIRAVCEAIIEAGCAPAPLKVEFQVGKSERFEHGIN